MNYAISAHCGGRAWLLGHLHCAMKVWYDNRARERSFEVDDEVLALLPIPGCPLQARYSGPFVVDKKLNEVDYVIATLEHIVSNNACVI